MFGSKKKAFADAIIMDNERASVEVLRRRAKNANMKFWGIAVSMGMVSTMVLPYMSMAAVAPSDSNVFTGQVIPGYSMGGVQLAAFGVDINSWGQVNKDKVVQTNYGVWSGSRVANADKNLKASGTTVLESGEKSADYELNSQDKSIGWKGITGRMGYSRSNPNGLTSERSSSKQYDVVAPYRTVSDYNFWDRQSVTSSGSASASVTVSLYADFVIIALDDQGRPHILTSPDDATGGTSNTAEATKHLFQIKNPTTADNAQAAKTTRAPSTSSTTSVPYYVSLKDLFDAYGINEPADATIDTLMEKVEKDPSKMASVAKEKDLLLGTEYSPNNSDVSKDGKSKAFNPYPYSMVFERTTNNGVVYSSIYDNSEAYVYFAPSSVYTQYIALRAEYEALLSAYAADIKKSDAQSGSMVFRLGYYLAEMSILEAYLNEALPQDMTRGYVGPSENKAVLEGNAAAGDGKIKGDVTPTTLKQNLYSSLYYDYAVNSPNGEEWRQHETDAIMDTLSVFGYWNKGNAPGTGVMKGYEAIDVQQRPTIFGVYRRDVVDKGATIDEIKNASDAGIYVPVYYPIQQHVMVDSEKVYRFQIINAFPYETLLDYIKNYGFSQRVKFTFTTEEKDSIENFNSITEARNRVAQLAAQYEAAESTGLEDSNIVDLKGVNGQSLQVTGGTAGDDDSISVTAKRVDAALMNYEASAMNSDNVHDLFDVVRATRYLKYETWYRYYNPLKSGGGDNDLFVTRITPAVTTYFPALLVNGYTAAGGKDITGIATTTNCSFDYFAVPSFGPCFASHTSDDTYYGVLNYELRPFYAKGFITTLSETANVAAMEAYQASEEALEQLEKEQAQEGVTIDKNLAALYVMGKRLAYVNTIKYITSNRSWAGDTLLDFIKSNGDAGDAEEYQQLASKTWAVDAIKNADEIKALGDMFTEDAVMVTQNNDKYGKLVGDSANPFKNEWFGIGSDKNNPELHEEGNDENKLKVNAAYLFSSLYERELNKILGSSGKYYWDDMNKIKKILDKTTPSVTEGCPEYDAREKDIYTVCFKATLEQHLADIVNNPGCRAVLIAGGTALGALFGPAGAAIGGATAAGVTEAVAPESMSDSDIAQVYVAQMDACAAELATAVENLAKDAQLLTQAMPTKMQNCLAWADYQNSSDSEAQYQTDPSDNNVTINLAVSTESDEYDPTKIKKKSDLAKYGMKMSAKNGEYQVVGTGSGSSSTIEGEDGEATEAEAGTAASDISGRMERGVEGSTWTSSTQPAVYTMSATIARVSKMSVNTGTIYPYYGLANGRLQSGTDQYAVLQSHVIDYSSIASGIAGDLSTRVRSQVVSIVEPQFASLSDFGDIMGIFSAFLGETGTSMINGAASVFSSAMWPSKYTTASTTNGMSGATAASVSYTAQDGITMNRTPAALGTFNPGTGEIDYASPSVISNNQYMTTSTSQASAAAGGNSGIADTAGIVLTIFSGMYKGIQTIALSLVLVFIAFIAFRNFYAYTTGQDHSMIVAQTQLKGVLWRSIVALVMIGLPPMAGGTGFEGGNFILLEVMGNISTFLSNIFVGDNGAGIMAIFTNVDVYESIGLDIFMWLLYFICCLLISLCFLIGWIFVCVLQAIQCLFFFFGPIVWALFVWPYSSTKADDNKTGPILTSITSKMNLGFLTGGSNAVGNVAPKGHIYQFALLCVVSIAWSLIFWFIAQIFMIGAGASYSDTNTSTAAMLASSSGYSTASMAVSHASNAFFDLMFGAPAVKAARLLFTTLVCVACFLLMGFLLVKFLFNQFQQTKGLGSDILNGIKNGVAGAAAMGDAVGFRPDNMVIKRDADGKFQGLQFKPSAAITKGGLAGGPGEDGMAKRHKLKDTSKQLKRAARRVERGGALGDDMKKALAEQGIDLNDKEKVSKKLREMSKEKKQEAKAAAAEAPGRFHALGMDSDGNYNRMRALGGAAKIAQGLGSAAMNGTGAKGILDGLTQASAAMQGVEIKNKNLELDKENAVMEQVKAAADKISEGGLQTPEEIGALDPRVLKQLETAGLVKKNEKGEYTQTLGAAEKAHDVMAKMDTQIQKNMGLIRKNNDKIAKTQNALAEAGFETNATLADGLKALSEGYDNNRMGEVIAQNHFVDDGDGTAKEKALRYLNDMDYRHEVDSNTIALESAARLLGLGEIHGNSDAARHNLAKAQQYVAARPAMKELCGASSIENPVERARVLQKSISSIAAGIGHIEDAEQRHRQIEIATGVPIPAPSQWNSIIQNVQNGTATHEEYLQYGAIQIESMLKGEAIVRPAERSLDTAVATLNKANSEMGVIMHDSLKHSTKEKDGVKEFAINIGALDSVGATVAGVRSTMQVNMTGKTNAAKELQAKLDTSTLEQGFEILASQFDASRSLNENITAINEAGTYSIAEDLLTDIVKKDPKILALSKEKRAKAIRESVNQMLNVMTGSIATEAITQATTAMTKDSQIASEIMGSEAVGDIIKEKFREELNEDHPIYKAIIESDAKTPADMKDLPAIKELPIKEQNDYFVMFDTFTNKDAMHSKEYIEAEPMIAVHYSESDIDLYQRQVATDAKVIDAVGVMAGYGDNLSYAYETPDLFNYYIQANEDNTLGHFDEAAMRALDNIYNGTSAVELKAQIVEKALYHYNGDHTNEFPDPVIGQELLLKAPEGIRDRLSNEKTKAAALQELAQLSPDAYNAIQDDSDKVVALFTTADDEGFDRIMTSVREKAMPCDVADAIKSELIDDGKYDVYRDDVAAKARRRAQKKNLDKAKTSTPRFLGGDISENLPKHQGANSEGEATSGGNRSNRSSQTRIEKRKKAAQFGTGSGQPIPNGAGRGTRSGTSQSNARRTSNVRNGGQGKIPPRRNGR